MPSQTKKIFLSHHPSIHVFDKGDAYIVDTTEKPFKLTCGEMQKPTLEFFYMLVKVSVKHN